MPSGGPSGRLALGMLGDDEGAVGNVAQDSGAGGDVDIVADFDRRDKLRVASDHAAVADLGDVLVVTVVVDGDNAASDVGIAPDDGVAEIAQVAGLGAAAETSLFGLDEIADTVMAFEMGAFAEIGERSDLAFIADVAIFGADPELEMGTIADDDVAQPCGALDEDVGADAAAAHDLDVGADDGVAADLDVGADVSSGGVDEGDAGVHQAAVNLIA